MVAQCLLQNYFNSVYHATMMLMLLGMLAAGEDEPEWGASISGRMSAAGRSL